MEFEKFEIYDEKNKRVNVTHYAECLPRKEYIDSMLKNDYKFKLDGKVMTKKAIKEFIKKWEI